MRIKLVRLLLLFILPMCVHAQVHAQGVKVKKSMASMVKEVIARSGMENVSVSPNSMTPTSINIDKINGVGLCDPAIKPQVEKLAKLFSKHRHIRNVISSYGVYVKKQNGKVTFLPSTAPQVQHLVGDCKNLYLSVY